MSSEVADQQLDRLTAAVEQLRDADRTSFDATDWLRFAQGVERLRRRLGTLDHQILARIEHTGAGARDAARDTAATLVLAVDVSRGEAKRRVPAAALLGHRPSPTGPVLPPRHPHLADAERTGRLGREHRQIAVECLTTLADRFGAGISALERAEQTLVQWCDLVGVEGYRKVAHRIVEVDYPDGLLPDDHHIAAAREVRLTQRRDGSYRLSGTLTGECGARLSAVLDAYARPANRGYGDDPAMRDDRTYPQRLHDAVDLACLGLLRSGGLPDAGGVPATVIVTIGLDQLTLPNGSGLTGDGQRLSAAAIGRLLNESLVLPTVVDERGVPVWQGADKRLATPQQTRWLIARDQGCSFPACDQPPAHCERHHIIGWAQGGPTTLDNLTSLCGHHHRQFHHAGWTCQLVDGSPWWTPPARLDPHRQPRLNDRIAVRIPDRLPLRT